MSIEHKPSSDYQIHPRFYVDWRGHAEDDFHVVDGLEKIVISTYSPHENEGSMNARRRAFAEAAKRNAVHYSNVGTY
jgi:hypothetical protein